MECQAAISGSALAPDGIQLLRSTPLSNKLPACRSIQPYARPAKSCCVSLGSRLEAGVGPGQRFTPRITLYTPILTSMTPGKRLSQACTLFAEHDTKEHCTSFATSHALHLGQLVPEQPLHFRQ